MGYYIVWSVSGMEPEMSEKISRETKFPLPVREPGTSEELGRSVRRIEQDPVGTVRVVTTEADKNILQPITTYWTLREYTIGRHVHVRWTSESVSHRIYIADAWTSSPYQTGKSSMTYATFERAVRAAVLFHQDDLRKAVELLTKYQPELLK